MRDQKVQTLLDALDKIRDPRKRDHREPDSYTELGCVMNIADQAIKNFEEAENGSAQHTQHHP